LPDPLENSVKLIQRVEKTHKNLGLPTMFAKLVDLSDLGLFLIADRGRGKTQILNTIVKIRHRDVMEVSIVTFAGVIKLADQMSDKHFTMINKDFSTFYTAYLKDVGVNLIASLITDHSVKASTGKYKIEIQNCYLSFLSATQPQMVRGINRLDSWESMYRDRFLRFDILYMFGTPKYTKADPEPGEYTWEQESPNAITLPKAVREHPIYERMKTVLMRQTSEGRCEIYLERLLRANAYFNNRDIVIVPDLEMLELFVPNLLLDVLLSARMRAVSEPMIFNADSYLILFHLIERGPASRAALREHFNVSHATLIKNLNPLLATNIVKGTYGSDQYKVNPSWIERYIAPVIKWSKEHGIKTE